ncbi:MAG: AmmeMemoRadiSam system protein A [Campylobacterota bacterium]|nr:AmmeMemoRadiSam system protein A [Campylobacterota bacterium]
MKEILLSLARASIADVVGVGYELDLDTLLETNLWLQEEGASFVTITIDNGQLRGCIGSIVAHRKLYEDIIYNAKSAAINDPRFNKLTKDEFNRIRIEVSLLSEPKILKYSSIEDLKAKIQIGIDGVILKNGANQATFLPQVWEELSTFELFFSHLCQKAGLDNKCLSLTPEIYIYQVEKYKEI